MNHSLSINDLLEYKDESGNTVCERVLWLDSNNTIAFVIEIFSQDSFPQLKRVSDIEEELASCRIVKTAEDPWAKAIRDSELTDKEKQVRGKAWSIIAAMVSPDQEPVIYYSHLRGPLVSQAIQQSGVTKTTVYRHLRRYWQRGKTENALLPDYDNSGGRGKPKKAGEKKRGRPRKYAVEEGIGVGINVDDEVKKIFRVAANMFHHNTLENSLTTTYELMLKEFYAEDYTYENGVKKSILIPQGQKPTFSQFKYWYEKEQDFTKAITSRRGAKRFALENRATLGSSTAEVFGPGSRYQIDATVADVYLVSRYNRRWIVGRPVIYVVIDVFSRMITGVYVGLEGPSWLGAMMALTNAATDKVQFCREYGITITESDWPCHHLPDAILGDRGEMESKMVEPLIKNLHIKIENAAPYRADWKGLVERQFRILHTKVKPFLPGYVNPDFRQRGGRDYRLDAKLDIHQFTEIIIRCILHHNNDHYQVNYSREETMIVDDVPARAVEFWRWGIQNRSGLLRSFPEDIVKLNLMPMGKATITGGGIRFKGMKYSCEKAIRELWFERAKIQKLEKLEVSYDPRNMNSIYIKDLDGRSFEKCFLLPSQERYFNKELDEIEFLLAHERLEAMKSVQEAQQAKVDLYAHIESIVYSAEQMTDGVQDELVSMKSKIADIRDHKAFEKALLREDEAFELRETENPSRAEIVQPKESSDKDLSYPSHIELLRKMRQERLNGVPD